jgi:hypothetical protein
MCFVRIGCYPLLLLLLLLVGVIPLKGLICPVYNLDNNETKTIASCNDTSVVCTYRTVVSTDRRRCLGIYMFDDLTSSTADRIRIRQLAIVDDIDNRYVNRTHCILDIDRTGKNLLCRCNTNYCTLHWRTASHADEDDIRRTLRMRTSRPMIADDDRIHWWLPLIFVVAVLLPIVIIVVVGVVLCNYRHSSIDKLERSYSNNDRSLPSTCMSNIDIEEFLSSNPTYQSMISHSKTSHIYRASMAISNNDDESQTNKKKHVAVKVYHCQQYKSMFDNEVEILRLVHHSTIVK